MRQFRSASEGRDVASRFWLSQISEEKLTGMRNRFECRWILNASCTPFSADIGSQVQIQPQEAGANRHQPAPRTLRIRLNGAGTMQREPLSQLHQFYQGVSYQNGIQSNRTTKARVNLFISDFADETNDDCAANVKSTRCHQPAPRVLRIRLNNAGTMQREPLSQLHQFYQGVSYQKGIESNQTAKARVNQFISDFADETNDVCVANVPPRRCQSLLSLCPSIESGYRSD